MSLFNYRETLVAFTSKDSERYHLSGIHFDEKYKRVWSMDGFRMFVTKQFYNMWPQFHGKTVDAKSFKADCELDEIIDSKYPDLTNFLPAKKFKNRVVLKVPEWFSVFTKKTKATKDSVVSLVSNQHGVAAFTVGLPAVVGSRVISFDPHLLSAFAGQQVFIRWNTYDKPMLITPANAPYMECDWFAIVMPLNTTTRYVEKLDELVPDLDYGYFKPDNKEVQNADRT